MSQQNKGYLSVVWINFSMIGSKYVDKQYVGGSLLSSPVSALS